MGRCPTWCTGKFVRIAKDRGGQCLSEYVDRETKMRFQCSKGHVWESYPANVAKGRWCGVCGGKKRHTLEDVQLIAHGKGGKCLSNSYTNNKIKMHFQCSEGHEWWMKAEKIIRGQWCRTCAGLDRKTMEDVYDLADVRGFKCLSTEYENSRTPMLWRCDNNHEWLSSYHDVRTGRGCSICWSKESGSRGERLCRKIFELLFDMSFPEFGPEWLINSDTGRRLRFDGYSERLKLAFEYNGRQHYEPVKIFNRKRSFETQQRADECKRLLCKNNDVILVEIPYYVDYEDMYDFIVSDLKEMGVDVPEVSFKFQESHLYAKV